MYSPLASAGGADYKPGGCIKKGPPGETCRTLKFRPIAAGDIASPPDTERTKLSMTAFQDTTPQPKNQHVTIEGALHPPRENRKHPLDAWLAALAAAGYEQKRTGANSYAGPCPLCEAGTDRFHLQGDPPVVGCRACDDGPKWYGQLCRLLFPREARQSRPERRSPASTPRDTRTADRQRDAPPDDRGVAYALRIWSAAASTPRDMTAPRAYLETRRCWPTFDDAPVLPACVRWLASPSDELVKLPADSVGCLVWAFSDRRDELRAVQLEALGADGGRLDAWPTLDKPAKRKTHGRLADAWLKLPRPGAHTLVLVEGPLDALAAHWLHPAAAVWCCGGGLRLAKTDLPADVEEIIIEADADATASADAIGCELLKAGLRVEIGERGNGDVADALAAHIAEVYEERAAIMEYDGELSRGEAEAEAIRLAWKTPPHAPDGSTRSGAVTGRASFSRSDRSPPSQASTNTPTVASLP